MMLPNTRYNFPHETKFLKLFRALFLVIYILTSFLPPTMTGEDHEIFIPLFFADGETTTDNDPPTNIILDNDSIIENLPANTSVGLFSTIDPNSPESFTYSLVAGSGDENNASFNIQGSELRSSVIFDYEAGNTQTIRVKTTDQGGLSFEKAFIINIIDENDAPVAYNQNLATEIDTSLPITLTGDDDDGDSISYLLISLPSNGVLSDSEAIREAGVRALPSLVYTPNLGFNGTDSFTYQVFDGQLLSNIATITIDVDDTTPPELTITGAMDGDTLMDGDLETGYILETTNDPAIDHLIQFAAGTVSNEVLEDDYFGLYLTSSTVDAADLKDYYTARGVPVPYLGYLQDAADGVNPFVYIKSAASTVELVRYRPK